MNKHFLRALILLLVPCLLLDIAAPSFASGVFVPSSLQDLSSALFVREALASIALEGNQKRFVKRPAFWKVPASNSRAWGFFWTWFVPLADPWRYDVDDLNKISGVPGKDLWSESEEENYQKEFAIFATLDKKEIREKGTNRPHQLKVWYFPKEKIWEVELRPAFGWRRFLARFGMPGSRSGRVLYKYEWDKRLSSWQVLTGTGMVPSYRDRGLFKQINQLCWSHIADSVVQWAALEDETTLKELYTALPAQYKRPQYQTVVDLYEHFKTRELNEVESLIELRRLVWDAYERHQKANPYPLVSADVLQTLKLANALGGPVNQSRQISVIAEQGGGLWIRSVDSKLSLSNGMPWNEESAFLKAFWMEVESKPVLRMSTDAEETYVKKWEEQFVILYEDWLGVEPSTELLREIRYNLNAGTLDTWGAEIFLRTLPASEHTQLRDKEVLAQFHLYLGNHDYMKGLQKGWEPSLSDLPELESLLASRAQRIRSFTLSNPQVYAAARLARGYKIEVPTIMEWVKTFRRIQAHLEKKKDEEAENIKKESVSIYNAHSDSRYLEDRLNASYIEAMRSLIQHIRATHPRSSPQLDWFFGARLIELFTDDSQSRVHNVANAFVSRLHPPGMVEEPSMSYESAQRELQDLIRKDNVSRMTRGTSRINFEKKTWARVKKISMRDKAMLMALPRLIFPQLGNIREPGRPLDEAA